MSQPVTRGELKQELQAFGEQLEARFDRKLEFWGGALNAKLDAMHVELARHTQAILQAMRVEIRAATDPFRDLPARVKHLETDLAGIPERVSRLEETVFPPKPRKRPRRRAA